MSKGRIASYYGDYYNIERAAITDFCQNVIIEKQFILFANPNKPTTMKHCNYSVALVCCCMIAVSCNNEITRPEPRGETSMTVSATFKSIPGGPSVVWNEADAISLFDTYTNNQFVRTEGEDTSAFTGIAVPTASEYKGLFPYKSGGINLVSGTTSMAVPTTQIPVVDGFERSYLTAVSYSTDPANHEFTVLPALLKLKLKGDHSIILVKFTSNNGEKITGTAAVSIGETITVIPAADASSEIKFSCSSPDGTFYMLALPQTLSDGFTLQLITEDNMMYEKVVEGSVALESGVAYDLGDFTTLADSDWVDAGANPNPTALSMNLIRASFTEGEFNVVSEPGFEDYPDRPIGFRTSWRFRPEMYATAGFESPTAIRGDNPIPGELWEAIQTVALKQGTDYRYSFRGMATTPHNYNGIRRSPGRDGSLVEVPGASWAPNTEWGLMSIDFNSEEHYFGDVFNLIFGDAGAWLTYDDIKLVPRGYDKKSMDPTETTLLSTVNNVMYSMIADMGKAVLWKDSDGKLRAVLSDITLNGVHRDTAVALLDGENLDGAVNVTGIVKDGPDLVSILEPTGNEISIVPNSVFTMNGKTYLHYYARSSVATDIAWSASSAGFLVSEDDGVTWEKGTATWKGNGCFAQAGLCVKDGFVYMAGSKTGRTAWDNYWGNMYVARVSAEKDITDPTQWEYWNNSVWVSGDENASNVPACCLTVGGAGEPALVYNPKFERFMMIYRSATFGGLVYRDADAVDGFWSGEKIITNDDITGLSYAPSVLEVTPEGDLLIVAPQL